jgi:hypothetical protein
MLTAELLNADANISRISALVTIPEASDQMKTSQRQTGADGIHTCKLSVMRMLSIKRELEGGMQEEGMFLYTHERRDASAIQTTKTAR